MKTEKKILTDCVSYLIDKNSFLGLFRPIMFVFFYRNSQLTIN